MAEDQKDAGKAFQGCCEGIPFAEMMKMMMAEKKPGSFNCAEMMSRMMGKCCGTAKEEEKERV
jgi:hypothetical protein